MKVSNSIASFIVGFSCAGYTLAAEVNTGNVTVDLYGRVVGGISYVNNGFKAGETGSKLEVASNQWGTSCVGASFLAPMGGGLYGVANLETGFGTLNGQTNEENVLFNRKANVGVRHDIYGQVTFGTHLMPSQDIRYMDPMDFQSMGINTLVNGINDTFAENSLVYESPEGAGFQLSLMKQFGGEVSDSDRNSGSGASIKYSYGKFEARAIYQEKADEFGRYTGGEFYGLGTQGQWLHAKTKALAASYDFPGGKVYMGGQSVKAPDSGFGLSYTFDDEADMFWLGLNYHVSKKLELKAAAYSMDQSYSGKKSMLYVLGLNYIMNDNMTFYTSLGHIENNDIDESFVGDVGVNNHALTYSDVTCGNEGNCNGVGQSGGYTGVVLKF